MAAAALVWALIGPEGAAQASTPSFISVQVTSCVQETSPRIVTFQIVAGGAATVFQATVDGATDVVTGFVAGESGQVTYSVLPEDPEHEIIVRDNSDPTVWRSASVGGCGAGSNGQPPGLSTTMGVECAASGVAYVRMTVTSTRPDDAVIDLDFQPLAGAAGTARADVPAGTTRQLVYSSEPGTYSLSQEGIPLGDPLVLPVVLCGDPSGGQFLGTRPAPAPASADDHGTVGAAATATHPLDPATGSVDGPDDPEAQEEEPAALPGTGLDVLAHVGPGVLLIAIGAAALVTGRRRRGAR